MAFKVTQNEAKDRWVQAEEALWLNADRSKIVGPDDPEAAFLFSTPGKRIERADAIRYGLIKGDKGDKAAEAEEGAELVDAKVADVLAEVGSDKARAQAALAAEQASESPRSTLVAGLEAVLAAEEV